MRLKLRLHMIRRLHNTLLYLRINVELITAISQIVYVITFP